MTIRQEKETLQQAVQIAEDMYNQTIKDLDISENLKDHKFNLKLMPSINRRSGEVVIVAELSNDKKDGKTTFTLDKRTLSLKDLSQLLDVDYDKLETEINNFLSENKEYLWTEWNSKNNNNYIAEIMTWMLLKLSWLSVAEIKEKLEQQMSKKVNDLIKAALLEEKVKWLEKITDYNQELRDLGLNDNYIIFYDWSAKIIYNAKENKKEIKFYWSSSNFIDMILSDKKFAPILTIKDTDNYSEDELLDNFKSNFPDVFGAWSNKIKKETINKKINSYKKLRDNLKWKKFLVLKENISKYSIAYADENWNLIIEDVK